MKIIYTQLIICMISTPAILAQDPVGFVRYGINTQITQQDSLVVISTVGAPFGGIYQQNGLIIDFELFPYSFLVSGTTGTQDLLPIAGLLVYPNPVRDIAILQREHTEDKYLIHLWSIDGSILQETIWHAGDAKLQITLEKYAAGLYVLAVTDAAHTRASHFKIVKR